MRSVLRNMAFGRDLVSLGAPWQIGGIRVDNPSGSWLRIPGVEQYVPPYTTDWEYPFIPNVATVSVLYADSPSGSISQQIGTPPTVTIYDTPIGPSQGFPSGTLGLTSSTAQDYQRVADFFIIAQPGGGAVNTLISAPGARSKTNILRISAGANIRDGVSGDWDTIHTVVTVVFYELTGVDVAIAMLALSPESPSDNRDFLPGSLVIDGANDIRVAGIVEEGGSNVRLTAEIQYYFENDL